ncbi:MAG: glycosyltransferase family 39 protein [Rhodospirillaceae bacterium]|nr:glycosyltransferase family 39 protein [Rhodospirillaceae bacterium]MYH37322.1 glycosyltransferase family 39 protein [Rhodospirillaceae bacterium]MYK12955.1 glycosyltransferase family 39 protein [Rhodospirillaceae bacterium]
MAFFQNLAARPGRALVALCAAQALFWTLAPALTHSAPPLDVVEMLVWGREGVVATYKHPNLPGLLLEAVRLASFGALWPVYLFGQGCVAATFAAVYLLGRDLLGPGRALAGTLLLTGIFYYSWPTPEVNHNLLQMPLWAWTGLALWRAVQRERILWWVLLGLFAGLSLWAKYSSGLLLLAAFVWLLADGRGRACFSRPGPWLALAVCALVALPQAIYLVESGFLPLDYATTRAGSSRAGGPVAFLLAQLADHAVFALMALAAGLFGAGAARAPAEESGARRFLLILGVGPLLLTVLAAAAAGLGLKDMWGMPMFNWSGLLLMALLPGRFDGRRLARLGAMAAGLLVLVPAAYAAAVLFGASISDKPVRVAWPQDAIAGRLLRGYIEETGAAPRIVVGHQWLAGLVALKAPGDPSVSINADPGKSHWVSDRDIAERGALAVWRTGRKLPPAMAALAAGRPLRRETFRWSDSPTARPIRITWTVIPPRPPGTRKTGSADR